MNPWIPRALALAALAATAIALVAVLASSHTSSSTSAADVTNAYARLSDANRSLSRQLLSLKPGGSPRPAQDADRSAQALVRDLMGQFDAGDQRAKEVGAVLRAELDYLDAVGSSVANPHSVLLDDIVPRADALREALTGTDPGSPDDVRGDAKLVAFSKSRG